MRTLSEAQTKILATRDRVSHLRVQVKNADGDWVDLSTLEGRNWIVGARWRESVDQPVADADIELVTKQQELSLATLDEGSKLNQLDDVYSPLLTPWREIKIETATLPPGVAPTSGDWVMVFHGRIDSADWATSTVRLQCRDLAGFGQDCFIEHELWHGLSSGTPRIATWQPNVVLPGAPGPGCVPSALNGYFYYSRTGVGTTGATEPTWPTTIGNTAIDGTVTWECWGTTSDEAVTSALAVLMAQNGAYPWTDGPACPMGPLRVIDDPSWNLRPFRLPRQPLLDALRGLAAQIGYELRLKWDTGAGSSRFKLCFYEPDRDNTDADHTFVDSEILQVGAMRIDLSWIRNAVDVIYSDASDLLPNGVDRRRKKESAEDATSIAAYGRRWCEIAEASCSNIDSSTEAAALAAAVLADLKDPVAEKAVEVRYFWPAELGDLYSFPASSLHHSAEQKLAVREIEHDLRADGSGRTRLVCSGTPASMRREWFAMIAQPGVASSARLDAPSTATGVTTWNNAYGMGYVAFTPPADRFESAELYLNQVNNFTPGSANLYARGKATVFNFALTAGSGTWYGRIYIRDEHGNLSPPTAQFSFTV